MSEQWGRAYVLLGLRIEKAFPGFVDGYYGPQELKAQVDSEPVRPAADLVRDAVALADSLSAQGFEPRRQAYLERQVRAIEVTCRKLNGETFSLDEEVQRCFDIRPEWTPEAQFEKGLALIEEALPGAGSLTDRMQARRTRFELKPEQSGMIEGLMRKAIDEVRRRTLQFIDLPEGEGVELRTVKEQPWGAYNWYLGNARSLIELNTDLPTNVSALIGLMAHEGYPGHHVEHALKEKLLFGEKGYLEHSILLINTPECVISEGIATLAEDMIFAPGEAGQWLAQHVYPEAGISPQPNVDVAKLSEGLDLLAGVRGNAVFMLHAEGRTDDEVVKYLMKYSLLPEDRARKSLGFSLSPLWRAYTFTYFYGRRLMLPLLQGQDRHDMFRRFLTEQVYPSLLVQWAKER